MEINFFGRNKLDRLALRVKKGDRRAASELYDELVSKIFGFCLNRMHDRIAAEDLTHEIFLKLLEKVATFDSKKGKFPVWFWRLARNTLIDYYREKKSVPFSNMAEEEAIDRPIHANQAELFDEKLEYEKVRELVSSFAENDRDIFELRYISDLSYGEMAEILNKSEGTLRVAVSRLRQKIKKEFSN